VHPRATATLVDSATIRFLNKYELPLEELQPQDEGALNRLLQAQLPPAVDAAFAAATQTMTDAMQASTTLGRSSPGPGSRTRTRRWSANIPTRPTTPRPGPCPVAP